MLELTYDGAIAHLIMDRPPVNAMNTELLAALDDAFDGLRSRTDIRVVLLRSRTRAFCAGADIRMMRDAVEANEAASMVRFTEKVQIAKSKLEALPQATIAMIEGPATGGGFELALACDFRIAAHDARIGLPEITLGLLPAGGGTQRVTRLAGPSVAARLVMTGELVDGREAERLGLVQWSLPPEEVLERAQSLAARMAAFPRDAIAGAKACIAVAYGDRAAGFATEIMAQNVLFHSEETLDLLEAFFAARKTR